MTRPILWVDKILGPKLAQLLLGVAVHGGICRIAVLEASTKIGDVNSGASIFVNTLVAFLTLSQGFVSPVALDELSGPSHIEIQGPHCVLARSKHTAKMSGQYSQGPAIACHERC